MGAKGNSGAEAPSAEIRKKHGGDDQSALAADVGADPAANEAADDAADERARNHKAEQRIGGVGLGGVGQVGKSRIDEVSLQAVDRAVDHGRVIAKKQSAQRGDEGEQNNVRIDSRHTVYRSTEDD